MTVLFLSHSSRDRAVVQHVHDLLQAEGYRAVFLDTDPESGIPAGRDWERELYGQLRRADAVVFVGTESACESKWCHAELVLARSIGKPVFPLRVDDNADHALLHDVQWTDLTDDGLTKLWRGMRLAGLDPGDSFSWDATRPPYPGLESFTDEDAAVFFGRDEEVEHLLRLLTPTLERGANRFVGIVGPSGSGKSSLVRAGLLPRLARTPDRWLVLPRLVPHDRPLHNLARVLGVAGPLTPARFGDVLDEVRDAQRKPNASLLLFVDQAEELLRGQDRRAFFDLLESRDHPLWIVATLRSEFLGAAQELTTLIDDPVLLQPLDRSRLPEVVERPAARAGLRFEDGLVSRVVEDTVGGDALPMLAYTLSELWKRGSGDGVLTHEHYNALGGVTGALQRQVEKITGELRRRGRDDLVVPTLMRLVDVDAEGTLTRRRLPLSALSAEESEIVRAFVAARLLTSAESTVGVVHEALIRQWAPLREAAESRGDDLRTRSELERLALDWDRAGRHDSYLLRSERATAARTWAEANPDLASESALVADFLDRSSRHDEVDRRRLADVLATRILESFDDEAELRLPLALAAVEEYAPTTKALLALARALAAPRLCARFRPRSSFVSSVDWSPDGTSIVSATSVHDGRAWYRAVIWDPVTGKEIASVTDGGREAAARWAPDGSRILIGWNRQTVCYDAGLETRLFELATSAPRWSPDGTRIAGTDPERKHITVWDAATGTRLRTIKASDISWAPSGRLFVGQFGDRRSRIWNAETGASLADLDGRLPVWSPDGRAIATLVGQEVDLWDVTASQQGRLARRFWERPAERLELKAYPRSSPAWSPDAHRIAVGGDRGVTHVLRATGTVHAEDRLIVGPPVSGGTVDAVSWSPDGDRLVALNEGDAHVWHLGGDDAGMRLRTSGTALSWSADSTRLLTRTADAALIWDPSAATVLVTMLGPENSSMRRVAWLPGNTQVLTTHSDGAIRVWDAERGTFLFEQLCRSASRVGDADAAWSPTGDRILTRPGDGVVRVWHVASGAELMVLRQGTNITSASWSPDGSRILTAGGGCRVWDATTGDELFGIDDYSGKPSWSPDGAWFVTTGRDALTLRDAASGAPLARMPGASGHLDQVVAWSRDCTRVLADVGQGAVIWDTATGAVRARLKGHEGFVISAEWSPDQSRVLTGSRDGTARIWDPDTGTELACLAARGELYGQAAWSPDGTRIAMAADDDTVRIWSADQPGDLIAIAQRVVSRRLTDDERQRFGLPIPVRPPR